MKKLTAFILASIMLFSAAALCASGAATDRTGIVHERITTAGFTHPEATYLTQKRLDKVPVTYEAWVYVPREVYSGRAGAILGNYLGSTNDEYVNFEIHQNGVPRLCIGEVGGVMHDYLFTKAPVTPNRWTHVAIVYGTGDAGKQVYCYINGVFKQATAVADWYEAPEDILDNTLYLAGDGRVLNEQGFKGTLGDVAIYSDVRTKEEISADHSGNPDLNDPELMMYFDLSAASPESDIPDLSRNGYDMTYSRFWLTEKEMEEVRKGYGHEYEYVLAFLPDIQYMTQKYPVNLRKMFDFLVENGKTKKIEYVIGLGDITNANSTKEWTTVIRQTNRLNGYIPYSLVPGNHDVIHNSRREFFDMNYAKKTGYYYQHVEANGGFMDPESVRNTYLTFSVGEVDYIIINLDFGAVDSILEWAGSVLAEHPNHRAILATHGYLYADGSTLDGDDNASPPSYDASFNSGEDMWNKLVSKYDNIDMIVSGHIHSDGIQCTARQGDADNTVYQLLMDPQSTCNKLGGIGAIALMYFTADGNHAKVEYYSTIMEKYFYEGNKLIDLTFGNAEEDETTAEETTSPVTDTPTEPVTDAPEPDKSGCGGAIAAPALIVILSAPVFIRRRRKEL